MKRTEPQKPTIVGEETTGMSGSQQIRLSALQSQERALPGASVLKNLDEAAARLADDETAARREPEKEVRQKRRIIDRPRFGFD
ncbi:MAG: hypothetical protein SYC29_05125 [Planctomycetota bacterium]|nr:hypothetical protein [Planctomycetota bacterium]